MKGSTFIRKFFQTEILGLGFGVPVASAYVLLLITLKPGQVERILFLVAIVAAVVVLGIAMPTNYLLARQVKKSIDKTADGTITGKEAELLFIRLMKLPFLHGSMLFLRIGFGALVLVGYMYFALEVELIKSLMAVILFAYGSYLAALVVYMAASNLIRPIGRELVAKKLIGNQFVESKRVFGLNVTTRNILFLVVPIIFTNLTFFLSVYEALISGLSLRTLLPKIAGVASVNIFTLLVAVFLTLSMIRKPMRTLIDSLQGFTGRGNKGLGEAVPTDLSDEFAYVGFLMNMAMENFQEILGQIKNASSLITGTVQDLSVSSQEISTTSNEQAAAVKEIVSTMEDSDKLSKDIAGKVQEVSKISTDTKQTVENGMSLVKDSLSKTMEIKDSNDQTITGIKTLNEQIETIWEIVNIINGIADQTKIIAFNAELEASAAGEAGKNFQIVASEIRRLADGTVSSTSEIKSKINEIQRASDSLIVSSEDGTTKIKEGTKLAENLNDVFNDIMSSSDISAASAKQIEGSVNQQVSAYEQILMTLKQISEGIDNFVTSTKSTSESSEKLKEMSETLSGVVKRYITE